MHKVWRFVVLLSLLILPGITAQAQFSGATQVFLERDFDGTGRDRLSFIDMFGGENRSADINGERYTLAGDEIIYYDTILQQVMTVGADAVPETHPFIQRDDTARRVDWVLSPDGRWIAWTLTYDTAGLFSTVTHVTTINGAENRIVLEDEPRAVRALPVAFNLDNSLLYMDAHPDGLEPYMAYTQYAGLFSLNLETGETQALPGEPGCFCGAAFRAGQFLRLALVDGGYDVKIYDLENERIETIPAMRLNNFTQAGDILIAPDGTQAVYALSQIEDFGTTQQSVRTVFMQVDLLAMTQQPLTEPITTYVHPVAWTEDNTAILFSSPQVAGTWKIDLRDGSFFKVAENAYLGILQSDNE
ncbi:MAG: hypothetical protein ACPG7F_12675 [Aggregatilineales bacterium]